MLPAALAGCSQKGDSTTASSPIASETEALGLAEKHGLTKEDLKGKYTLFLKFAETIEANAEENKKQR